MGKELGDNLEGKNSENEVEEMSTFGVSTVNSSKSLLNPQMYSNSEFMQLQQKNEGLVEENNRLLKELIDVNETYQELLKKCIEEKRMNCNLLERGFLQNSTKSQSSNSDENVEAYLMHDDFKELYDWLKQVGADEETIKKFAEQMFTKEDVLSLMTREDLRYLGLKGGIELRIWHHILSHRKEKS